MKRKQWRLKPPVVESPVSCPPSSKAPVLPGWVPYDLGNVLDFPPLPMSTLIVRLLPGSCACSSPFDDSGESRGSHNRRALPDEQIRWLPPRLLGLLGPTTRGLRLKRTEPMIGPKGKVSKYGLMVVLVAPILAVADGPTGTELSSLRSSSGKSPHSRWTWRARNSPGCCPVFLTRPKGLESRRSGLARKQTDLPAATPNRWYLRAS